MIGSRTVNTLLPKDRDIAMVFQNYALYPHMTVTGNMGFSLKLRKVDPADIAQRVAETASILGLEQVLDRHPGQLSGGQRQRVAMGRAIVRDPQVFLFDEPLSNLDAKLRVAMRAEIKALHHRLRTTTVYVTHDQIEAMTMADRIVLLRSGKIEQVGTPLELYDRPANDFVAGFIGSPSMNFFRGEVVSSEFRMPGGAIFPLPEMLSPDGETEVLYGIRPQHVRIGSDGVPAQVVVVEPTGAETHVILRIGETEVTYIQPTRTLLKAGEKVHLSVDVRHAHVFDAHSGLRLST